MQQSTCGHVEVHTYTSAFHPHLLLSHARAADRGRIAFRSSCIKQCLQCIQVASNQQASALAVRLTHQASAHLAETRPLLRSLSQAASASCQHPCCLLLCSALPQQLQHRPGYCFFTLPATPASAACSSTTRQHSRCLLRAQLLLLLLACWYACWSSSCQG
jgi:hypothetical protein